MYTYNNASGRGEPPGVTASIRGVVCFSFLRDFLYLSSLVGRAIYPCANVVCVLCILRQLLLLLGIHLPYVTNVQ